MSSTRPFANQSSSPKQQKSKSRRNTTKRRQRQILRTRMIQSSLPAAKTFRFRGPRFRRVFSRRQEQRIVMTGYDLVNALPMLPPSTGNYKGTFAVIPSNPAYWEGTRISGIAKVYQLYKPLYFAVRYVPSVPFTVPGQVVYGTEWTTSIPNDSQQQSLATSNGGGITTVYQPTVSRVICSNAYLPQRSYNVAGDMSSQSVNPFNFRAMYVGPTAEMNVSPGYFILSWRYEFINAIGSTDRQFATITSSDSPAVKHIIDSSNLRTIEWGVVIGVLKNVAVQVLRHCAVYLLETVLAHLKQGNANDTTDESVRISSGAMLTYQTGRQDIDGKSIVTQNGVDYEIPDDTPVYVYMNGQPLIRSGPTPPDPCENHHMLIDFYKRNNGVAEFPNYNLLDDPGTYTVSFMTLDVNITLTKEDNIYKKIKAVVNKVPENEHLYARFISSNAYVDDIPIPMSTAGSIEVTIPFGFIDRIPAYGPEDPEVQFDTSIDREMQLNRSLEFPETTEYIEHPDNYSFEYNLRSHC